MQGEGRHSCVLEPQASDGDLGVSKDRPDGRTQACAGVGRANDQGHIQPPGIAQPPICPATKHNETAALGIIHPRCVLPVPASRHSEAWATELSRSWEHSVLHCGHSHAHSWGVLNQTERHSDAEPTFRKSCPPATAMPCAHEVELDLGLVQARHARLAGHFWHASTLNASCASAPGQ